MSALPIAIPIEFLREFCERNHTRKLSVFGSVLTPRFRPESDIDLLVIIEARGIHHEIHVRADQIVRRPRVDRYQKDLPVQMDGTRIVFERLQASLHEPDENPQNVPELVSDFALFNPHASFSFNGKRFEAPNPDFRKWMPTDATPAGWYTLERFEELAAATLATGRNITVRDFLANFRGLARTQVRAAILVEANMQRGTSLAELAVGARVKSTRRLSTASGPQYRATPPTSSRKLWAFYPGSIFWKSCQVGKMIPASVTPKRPTPWKECRS